MSNKNFLYATFCVQLLTPIVSAQDDVWSGLARTQFDSAAATLRIPCAVLEDENGNSIPGFAPAYALNLLLVSTEINNEMFRLVDPIQAFEEIPDSCLDTLTVPTGGSTATYTTTSAEIDTRAAAFIDEFYSLELQADLSGVGADPVDFSVVVAERRDYSRPFYNTDTIEGYPPSSPFNLEFIWDDDAIDAALASVNENLVVFESGRIDIECFFSDPDEVLEELEVVGTNVRYRLKSSLSSADNSKSFSVNCTVFNPAINRLDDTITWFVWYLRFP